MLLRQQYMEILKSYHLLRIQKSLLSLHMPGIGPVAPVDEPVVGAQIDGAGLAPEELGQAFRVGEAIVAEGDHRALGASVQLRHRTCILSVPVPTVGHP